MWDHGHYDMHGMPISMDRWCELMRDDERFVARDEVGGYLISTVWLGLDHNFGHGPPLIFETMAFSGTEVLYDVEMWRWPTKEAALAGHEQAVMQYRQLVAELDGVTITEDET